jgi:hypothetical protein
MRDYNKAFYTIQDIRDAEVKSGGVMGHVDIMQVLEQMISLGIVEIPWFRLAESDRDIISDYCGIKPRFNSIEYYTRSEPEQCPHWWFEQSNGRWRCKLNAGNREYEEAIIASAVGLLNAQIKDLKSSLDFYKRRCNAIQKIQSRMRDPERQAVCEILANGAPIVGGGKE